MLGPQSPLHVSPLPPHDMHPPHPLGMMHRKPYVEEALRESSALPQLANSGAGMVAGSGYLDPVTSAAHESFKESYFKTEEKARHEPFGDNQELPSWARRGSQHVSSVRSPPVTTARGAWASGSKEDASPAKRQNDTLRASPIPRPAYSPESKPKNLWR